MICPFFVPSSQSLYAVTSGDGKQIPADEHPARHGPSMKENGTLTVVALASCNGLGKFTPAPAAPASPPCTATTDLGSVRSALANGLGNATPALEEAKHPASDGATAFEVRLSVAANGLGNATPALEEARQAASEGATAFEVRL
jgi:hypothetical protein